MHPVRAVALSVGVLALATATAQPGGPVSLGGYVDIGTSLVGPGASGRVFAVAAGPDGTLWAAGTADNGEDGWVSRWDGASWTLVGGAFDDMVLALAVGPDGAVYAGGSFSHAGAVAARGMARWDGGAWHPLGAGVYDPSSWPSGATDIAFGPDGSLYVGGAFTHAGTVQASCAVARWDGTAWSAIGACGGTMPYVNALAVGPDGAVYTGAVGVRRWNGTAWEHLTPEGSYPFVRDLLIRPDGALYIVGSFDYIGNVAVNDIARWDGTTWAPVGVVDHSVHTTLQVLGQDAAGNLYAGGYFNRIGGLSDTGNLARWDGEAWQRVGAYGVDGDVFALATLPSGALAIGGVFSNADGIPSPRITLNVMPSVVDNPPEVPGPTPALTLGPNPARGAATAWISVTGNATVTVHDALGRLVATPFDGEVAGRTAVRLPDRLPPGVYSVRLAAGDAVETAQLIVVR